MLLTVFNKVFDLAHTDHWMSRTQTLVHDQPKINGLGLTRGHGDRETRRILTLQTYLGRLLVSRLLRLSGLVLFLFLIQLALLTEPAMAVLRQHQDAPGVMRYHSQQSLPDESGNAWQVLLFKQVTPGMPTLFFLRLVSFPGLAEFTHPQRLEIITAGGQVLTASDAFAQGAPAPNVGQFDFTEVLTKLQTSDALTLSVPLTQTQTLALKIPQPLVVEWQWLAKEL